MPITVGDHTYIVGKASKSAANIQHPVLKTWHIFKRHAGESDAMMQKRVIDYFDQMTNDAVSTPIAQPASPSNPGPGPSSGTKRPKDKLSPSSTASLMPPPPPKQPRKQTRGSVQLEAATGKPIEELLVGERQAAASGSADSRPEASNVLRRLEKKVREIERLQQQASDGRALSAEERTKVGELSALQRQIALLKQPTPGTTPAQTPGSTQTPSSELSGASTQIGAAACFASDYASAQAKAKSLLISPPTRAPTRHMPAEVQQQLADERAGRELARQAARQEAREAEQATWQLLRAPFDSWEPGTTKHPGSSPCASSPWSTSPTWPLRQSSSNWTFGRRVRT